MDTVIFTDRAMADIAAHVGSCPPEAGGALLGIPNTNVITEYIADTDAVTSSMSFTPSLRLGERVNIKESEVGLSLFGILHSHPNNLDQPSSGDLISFQSSLDANPHIGSLVTPIVNFSNTPPSEEYKISLNKRCIMTTYYANRNNGSTNKLRYSFIPSRSQTQGAIVKKTAVSILYIKADIEMFKRDLESNGVKVSEHLSSYQSFNGVLFFSEMITLDNGYRLSMLIPPLYPASSPLIFISKNKDKKASNTVQLKISWLPFSGRSDLLTACCLEPTLENFRRS